MNIQKKQEMQSKFDHTNFACMKALSHSRVVFDFRVISKKDFDDGWGKTHSSGCLGGLNDVKKTHRFVGVLTITYCGQYLHYAVSHNDPIFAAALVLKHTLARYEGTTMHAKLMRIHQKFFKVILAPKA